MFRSATIFKKVPNSPSFIQINKIQKMTNKYYVQQLERKYDEFLEKYCQLLLLYNIMDDYLEIRDALTIQLNNIQRNEDKLIQQRMQQRRQQEQQLKYYQQQYLEQ